VHYGKTPYIVLLHEEYFYEYKGSPNDRTGLIDFALNGFVQMDDVSEDEQGRQSDDGSVGGKRRIPTMPTVWDEIAGLYEYML